MGEHEHTTIVRPAAAGRPRRSSTRAKATSDGPSVGHSLRRPDKIKPPRAYFGPAKPISPRKRGSVAILGQLSVSELRRSEDEKLVLGLAPFSTLRCAARACKSVKFGRRPRLEVLNKKTAMLAHRRFRPLARPLRFQILQLVGHRRGPP